MIDSIRNQIETLLKWILQNQPLNKTILILELPTILKMHRIKIHFSEEQINQQSILNQCLQD